jgi:hypothetical protein
VVPLIVKENEEDENEVGKEYRLVFIDDVEYLMTDDQLCKDPKDAVKEKSGFVTLPCVLYKDPSGPAIAGMASKGSQAEITGFANLLADGGIDRYQVNVDGQQGYIRSEYLVKTAEEVKDTWKPSSMNAKTSMAATMPIHWNIRICPNLTLRITICQENAVHFI